MVWYLVIFSASYLTSNTAAVFTTNQETNGMITIGTWEEPDDSQLAFVNKGNQNVKACGPTEIKVKLKNNGKGDMQNNSTYEVHYIKNGNPEKDGEKVDLADGEGEVKVLKRGDTTELIYTVNEPGIYAFLAKQINDDLDNSHVWSKWVKVHCSAKKPTKMNDQTEDKKTEESEQDKSGEANEEEKEDKPIKSEKADPAQKENKEMKEPETEQTDKKEPEEVKADNKDKKEEKTESTGESKTEAKTETESNDNGKSDVEQDGEEA